MNLVAIVTAFGLSLSFVNNSKNQQKEKYNNPLFSSMIDPEEVYSTGKLLGDIGIFNGESYDGTGIKIGIIEAGIPKGLSFWEQAFQCYGSSESEHATNVYSVLKTVAPNATYYFASNENHDFEDCIDWMINTKHVDIINHSAGYKGGYEGKYRYSSSRYIDEVIRESGTMFVNAVGNTSYSNHLASIAMGINVFSSAANDKSLNFASINSYAMKEDFDTVISKPTCLTPGEFLYGFSSQDMTLKDETNGYSNISVNNDSTLTGTSFSAPLLSGIIALLLQEFPSIKGKPETMQSIIKCSSDDSGVLNYQLARQAAKNFSNYLINTQTTDGDLLLTSMVSIPIGETIHIANFVLFNDVYNHPNQLVDEVLLNEIQFSTVKISIVNSSDNVIFEDCSTFSGHYMEFTNNTNETSFAIKVSLFGNKSPVGNEKACLCYYIKDYSTAFNLTYSNYYLDTLPTFSWNIDYFGSNDTISLIFRNFRNQVVFQKNGLTNIDSYTLSFQEWQQLIDLRGREFYVFLKLVNNNGEKYYSQQYLLNEPKVFGQLYNINPVDFNFPEQYYFYELTTYHQINNINITVKRLRCGYIQKQYINLSAKRENAGHAYLELVFDRKITYLAFGVTLWRPYELLLTADDTAVVETLNASNQWVELIDLLDERVLPSSRKDIVRFDVSNIYGIRFDVTSTPSGGSNKGRLCVDNITFTDDNNYNSYLSSFYEPIVVRESFATYSNN